MKNVMDYKLLLANILDTLGTVTSLDSYAKGCNKSGSNILNKT